MPVKKFIEWLGFNKSIQAPPGVRAKFLLKYGDLLVGTLSVQDGKWKFEYSDEFRRKDLLRPIVEFPDVNKTYESDELWQFFASRIPSPEQAEVEEILKRENIEEDDAVRLLQRFGKRTIANPFELETAA
ncbi:MAG: HipA N-terminal domain-containing protein [Acidobacteria bacterium]|nr:HipA N-terminal domain-containing protein [Acidobacteriota bacterium]